tara:strand:+ start:95 stop:490 length:396 start_codon:yes stop_codon:yes gene_type:complete
MSKKYGTQWKPQPWSDGSIMMRVNPEPVVLTAEEIVSELTYHCFDFGMKDEIMSMNKTRFKKQIKAIVNYMAYNYDGHEYSYHDGTNLGDDAQDWLRTYQNMAVKLMDMFPEFEQVKSYCGNHIIAYAHKM